VPDEKTIVDPSRGPLSGISDASARKEISNLWTLVEGRMPATGKSAQPHTLATHADITRLEAALSKRIETVTVQTKTVVQGSSGGSSAGLLGSNNTWTGTNQFTKLSQFWMLDAGPLFKATPTIMPGDSMTAAVDIRRTSYVADATKLGGSAALYIQHRAEGTQAAGTDILTTGLRCQMETTQQGILGRITDTVSGYFGLLNVGKDTGGFGVHVDAYHAATGNGPTTYGMSVEMFGAQTSQTGKTVGFLLRSAGDATFNRRTDYGFLASPDRSGSRARIEYPFSVGSDWNGPLECAIAFDAGHCNANLAGLRLATGSPIVFDGPSINAWRIVYDGSALQVRNGTNPLLSINNAGNVTVVNGFEIMNAVTLPPAPTTALTQWGYFAIKLGGIDRWVPFYA